MKDDAGVLSAPELWHTVMAPWVRLGKRECHCWRNQACPGDADEMQTFMQTRHQMQGAILLDDVVEQEEVVDRLRVEGCQALCDAPPVVATEAQ